MDTPYRLTPRRMAAMVLTSRIEAAMRAPITTSELQSIAVHHTDSPVAYTERTRVGVAHQATKLLAPVVARLDRLNAADRDEPVVLTGESG